MAEIVELPDSLPYPEILPLDKIPQLEDKLCYVVEGYSNRGIGMLIVRHEGTICIRLSEFDGTILSADKLGEYDEGVSLIMKEQSHKLIATMKYIGIKQALFYFAFGDKGPLLVDMRLTLNKFCGPGYLRDFIGRQGIPIQKYVGKPIVLSQENRSKMLSGEGIYGSRKFIIKPSVFKFKERDRVFVPLYGKIGYET